MDFNEHDFNEYTSEDERAGLEEGKKDAAREQGLIKVESDEIAP